MKTKVEPVAENEVELSVEVPADVVNRTFERTISSLRHDLAIPGFRKGHVPRSMVVAHYGEELIRQQTLEDAMPMWGDAALRESGLHDDTVGTSDLVAGPLDENADYCFTIRVQTMPTPSLGEYKGLVVPKRGVAITDEKVDEQLGLLRERLATLQPVEDRVVQNGDFVLMDLEGSRDGALIEGAQAKGQMFEMGNAQLIPGFEEEVIGVARDEEKTFDITFPDDYQAEELAGKLATFKIAVREIKIKVVPELNDEFAADVSEFETLAELHADLSSRLEAAAADGVERDFRSAVVDAAVANATVGVPRAMIDDEAHRLFHDFEADITKRGISMDTYLGVLEKTKEEAEEGMRPQAESVLKRRLVIDAVAVAEGLSVSDDEIAEAVKRDVEGTSDDYLKLLADLHKSERHELVRAELLVVRTVDFLAAEAVPREWTEADAPAAEAAGVEESTADEEAAAEPQEDAVAEAADADAPPVA